MPAVMNTSSLQAQLFSCRGVVLSSCRGQLGTAPCADRMHGSSQVLSGISQQHQHRPPLNVHNQTHTRSMHACMHTLAVRLMQIHITHSYTASNRPQSCLYSPCQQKQQQTVGACSAVTAGSLCLCGRKLLCTACSAWAGNSSCTMDALRKRNYELSQSTATINNMQSTQGLQDLPPAHTPDLFPTKPAGQIKRPPVKPCKKQLLQGSFVAAVLNTTRCHKGDSKHSKCSVPSTSAPSVCCHRSQGEANTSNRLGP